MSKLDEKLTASVKPVRGKTTAKPAPAKPTPAAKESRPPTKPRTGGSSAVDLNAATQPLFPARIWPD